MAACLIARRWRGAVVTVVEDPDIGIIGVGEGSTPQLKALFDTLGIAEADWMPRCQATFKHGIRFDGWSDRPGHASYFHPFAGPLDMHSAPLFFDLCHARQQGVDVPAHPDRFFLSALLAAGRKAPHPDESFPFDPGYGYHFDSALIGRVLAEHAGRRLGVRHVARNVRGAEIEDGRIARLVLADDEPLAGDLFIDASGFRALLAGDALGVPFLSFADTLFNDRAVVLPGPVAPDGPDAQTRATALSAGWAWAIPLQHRTGHGYVYASRYLDGAAAEAELRAHLRLDGGDAPPARHLTMRVGRLAESWAANCLAIGLAQGFVEPLEATALHIVQATVEGFIQAFEAGGFTPRHRDAFNRRIAARIDGIRDYIVCHYRMNGRRDTPYWRDAAALTGLSDSLETVLAAWTAGEDLGAVIDGLGIGGIYAPMSWYCLLAGYGAFAGPARAAPPPGLAARLDRVDDFLRRAARNFGGQKAWLAQTAAAAGKDGVWRAQR
ncbi:tryptophan 7-halogenase [Sphingomonas changnyeongensis]|uniref:Tryptophan 7-halogenase n=1 Tax=Sphingomonas changnyeongensis TaxID=2698679 RepID=A0A7Z2NVV7_9SPHN|nr:tryptophan halogenase family protein [Sphingomonas changnyeongensis]QHL90786.1 tryptophan 7-halogenase [Sphingomonas changnyeongensis]